MFKLDFWHGARNACGIFQSVFQLNFFVLSDEVDEIEVYGSEAQSGTQLATYSFEVKKTPQKSTSHRLICFLCLCGRWQKDLNCALIQVCDSILNIGPCANASMGEPAFLSEEVHTVNHFLCLCRLVTVVFWAFWLGLHLTHSSRATPSPTWRWWCALATARTVHCLSFR